jgi:hypothetical protein
VQHTSADIQRIYQSTELKVKKYSNLFQQAIESQELPQDYNSQELHQLEKEVDELSRTIISNTWCKLRSDLDSVFWLEYALKYPSFVKATIRITNKGPERIVVILRHALTLSHNDFCALMEPLLSIDCRFIFEDTAPTYTRAAFRWLDSIPLSLSPENSITIKLRDGKSVQFTRAELEMLLRIPVQNITELDWSEFDQDTLDFVYEANVKGRNSDTRWYLSHSSDQWHRLRLFLKKVLPQAFRDLYVYTAGNFLLSALEIKIAADRLSLEKEQFKTEMKALLAYCRKAKTVKIYQKNSLYLLTFTRQWFEGLIESGPEIFEPYTIKCKNDENYQIDADFYLEMMEYLSKRRISNAYKSIDEIDLSDFDKTTVDQAHFWFKTNQYPVLSWDDEVKLLTLLQLICPESKWHRIVQERLAERTPSFSEQDLQDMDWDTLLEELAPYSSKYVKLGQEHYSREGLEVLSEKSNRPKDLSTLARPIYFKFQNGAIVEGSFDWFITLDQMPGHSDYDNPILIEQNSELLDTIYYFFNRPLDQPFETLKRLEVFLAQANINIMRWHLSTAFQACTRIKLGEASKPSKLYWKEVSDSLRYYPQAKYIELDGCQISWTRGTVEAFIAHESIELRDLSETVDIKLISGTTREIVFYRMFKAEWKSFSLANPSQNWSEPDHLLPDSALKHYLAYGFNISPLPDHLELAHAYSFCNPIATPYFKKKIGAVLGVLQA